MLEHLDGSALKVSKGQGSRMAVEKLRHAVRRVLVVVGDEDEAAIFNFLLACAAGALIA